jgi:integrase
VREWGLLKESPFRGLSPPAEGRPRSRRVSDADADASIDALGYVRGATPETASQFVAAAFLLAIETAMRLGEILALRRDQVNPPVVHLPRTKNGEARTVPLTKAAVALLELLPADGYLFPITAGTADTLFRRARTKAGLVDLHFHDSRREGTTRLAAKVDVMTLAKITGHKDVKLLLRVYYAPRMEEVALLLD